MSKRDRTVQYLQDREDVDPETRYYRDLDFISDSQDVAALREFFPRSRKMKKCDSFFVAQEDGEYVEVWGIIGIIPVLDKIAYRIL